VKVLLNPVIVRGLLVLLAGMAAFAIGAVVIHRYRKGLAEESDSLSQSPLAAEGLPVHAYHAVIQQLKQQKHELTAQQLSERRKARASDALSAVVFANLPCGVLFFNTSGLLRQANPAARRLLGFASPIGMGLGDLFHSAILRDAGSSQTQPGGSLLDAISPALTGQSVVRGLIFDFATPEGAQRTMELTASPVLGEDTRPLGTTVVLTDKTEIGCIHKDQEAHRELAGEMALALRTSLATICGYAQQLAKSRDPEMAGQLAADISTEAAQLDHRLGTFLTGAKGTAAGSS
jgi:PAS domain-containing protein